MWVEALSRGKVSASQSLPAEVPPSLADHPPILPRRDPLCFEGIRPSTAPPLSLQGQLASWGASEFGQLGQGSEELSQPLPRIVKGGVKDVRFARWAGIHRLKGWAAQPRERSVGLAGCFSRRVHASKLGWF